MSKWMLTAMLLAMPFAASRADAGVPSAKKPSKVVATILQLEQQWDRAVEAHDRAELDKLMDPEFVATDIYGNTHTREDFLNALSSPDVKYDYRHSDNIEVHEWGNTAVAIGLQTVKARFREHDINDESRYIRVYVKHHGRWFTVAEQATPVSKGS
jgi:ketosteroid isomerase-like protein